MSNRNRDEEIKKWNKLSKEANDALNKIQKQRKAMTDNILDVLREHGFYAYWYRDTWDHRDRDPKAPITVAIVADSISSEFEKQA